MIRNDEKYTSMQEHLGTLKVPYALMEDISSLKNSLDISYHGLAILSGISMSTFKCLNKFTYTGEPNAKTKKIINDLQDFKGVKKYYKHSRKTQYSFRDREHLESYIKTNEFILRETQIDKISNTSYIQLNDVTNGYLDLHPSATAEQIFGAKVNINYAIDNINTIITLTNRSEFKLDSWYQLVIKADFIIDVVDKFLFKYVRELLGDCNLSFKSAITLDEADTIEYFRLIRSLTLAHPMGTTSFPKFGFTQATGRWLEDTWLSSSFKFDNAHRHSDVVLALNKKGEPTHWHNIFLERDIFWPVKIALNSLDTLSLALSKELKKLSNY
ncbi:hypothetical protein [Oenococcus oeni]|uniref:hypothetical protein n=1 Tax=Oenococcus oeni TaxID=1247 RepID=UPI000BDEC359|nr:hypothetical protein [Oenococcus oeni]PDH93566.1 hypothetical protein AO469_03815 [Oenococcus oeni]